VAGGLACVGAFGEDTTSGVSNGLLPAALALTVSTKQGGYDLSAVFGLYPGISTNDGGSPNLQQTAALNNTALGTAGLDIRQVYLTFGNDTMGTVLAGRNIGMFQSDVILADMTLLGVGAGNGNYAAPANTSLGSIGLGYIYTDWLAQIDYTTPDLSGFKLTVGMFDPLEPITGATPISTPDSSPGFHGKASFTAGDLYLSASFIYEKQNGVVDDYSSTGFDIGGKYKFGGLEVCGWYYNGSGIGTTALFLLGATALDEKRDSDGFLAQVTYKFGNTKVGVNYGVSNLDLASGEAVSNLVEKNEKFTVGLYQNLSDNLMLLAEYSDITSDAHDGTSIGSSNFNVGAFLSF
jgi:predicted porin